MNAPHDHIGQAHRHDPELERLAETAFIEGFRAASDKRAFLELTRIPQELTRDGAELKLMQVVIGAHYEVGAASPGFGGGGMVYHPLPGAMIREKPELYFVYVAMDKRIDLTLADLHLHAH